MRRMRDDAVREARRTRSEEGRASRVATLRGACAGGKDGDDRVCGRERAMTGCVGG